MSRTRSKTPKKRASRALPYSIAALLGLGALAGAGLYGIEEVGVTPRQLSPYIERRVSGHNASIAGIGQAVAARLSAMDRGDSPIQPLPAWNAGAQPTGKAAPPGNAIVVASAAALLQAVAQARPGDVITIVPGTYRVSGPFYIEAAAAGTKDRPITLRAAQPGSVTLDLDLSEGFKVTGPYWTFENLVLRGACPSHANCEHAFHVAGRANGFVLRNSTVTDFNSHIKINGQDGQAPDYGLIENNTLTNSAVRNTGSPVTVIDLVASSHWVIRGNLISDFIKGAGDNISYGAFAKGAGAANVFERNVVLCEQKLRGQPGQRIGLSLGGGGTGASYCRDKRCITEQDGGVIDSNLIASCSDEGIYLNRAATSKILHNTLVDTSGIMVRYPESSATIDGNIIDGRLRADRGAILRAGDNLETGLSRLYLGSHPERALYRDALAYNLAWSGDAPRRKAATDGAAATDLCGAARPAQPAYGAVENFGACLRR